MEDSIFTQIINGEIPCHKVYEDDTVIAFLDVHPLTRGHTLVVPKQQVDHVWDLDEQTYQYLWQVVKKLGTHIRHTLESPRVAALVEGFGVPHVHVHLVPIQDSSDLKQRQDVSSPINHEELAAVAAELRIT